MAAGFDLLLRDTMSWPSALLGELLHIPTVEFLPMPPVAPLFETFHSVPNPVAYIPQFGAGLTVNMVCCYRYRPFADIIAMTMT